MSFKAEVRTERNDPKFYGNALRFATAAEAETYASDLTGRWLAVIESRVVESDEPVNYQIVDGRPSRIEPVPAKDEGSNVDDSIHIHEREREVG